MSATLSIEERLDLVTRWQTLVNPGDIDSLKSLLENTERPKITWETTPTGRPHVGYIVPLGKFADFIKAGLEVTVFYLDVYGFLVNHIHPMELVEHRRKYYHLLMTAVLRSLGFDLSKIRFVDESSFAYRKEYFVDVLRTCALMKQQDAKDTCEETSETDMLSPLLCCVYQSLSEQYLDMDIQFGGEDQRGLFLHSLKYLPLLGYRKREHLMNVMVPGLHGGKMSSSHAAGTKIEFLDDPITVQEKIDQLPCEPGDVQSTVVVLLRDVLLPISQQRVESLQDSSTSWEFDGNDRPRPFIMEDAPQGAIFSIPAGSWGDSRHYTSFTDIQNGFGQGEIAPEALKLAVTNAFNSLLGQIRAIYSESKEWQLVDKLAYPD